MIRKGHLLALAVLAVSYSGCSKQSVPTSPETQSASTLRRSSSVAVATDQLVRNYVVHYNGRTFSGGKTTYSYRVTGTGNDPELSRFTIQLPSCAPPVASSTPNGGSIGIDAHTGFYGIRWDQALGKSQSRDYSITFTGNVPEGLVRVAVKAGSDVGVGVLPGPCGGFLIEGTVFVDPDASGNRTSDEPGILAGVTVTLVDDQGTETDVTDANGHYSFTRLDGNYTVRIDASTPASDFNEELFASFSATGPTSINVTVGPDANGVDFGFKPQSRKLISDFDLGILSSNGEPASFWTKAVRAAQHGKSYMGLTPAAVLAILIDIEDDFLPDPYQFTDGNELNEALAILTNRSKDQLDQLYTELFVAELNNASGKGILGHTDLMAVLMSYGEALFVDRSTPTAASRGGFESTAAADDPDISDATDLYRLINNARGGGDVPK